MILFPSSTTIKNPEMEKLFYWIIQFSFRTISKWQDSMKEKKLIEMIKISFKRQIFILHLIDRTWRNDLERII